MYKTISCLPLALTSFAVITSLYGCSATLPSHDGSLHSVYGIENSTPVEATTLSTPEPQQVAPVDIYEPTVQTLSGAGVIASAPISAITTVELTPETRDFAVTTLPMENIQTEPVDDITKDYEHKLGSGETLFSVARDLTGSSNNWKVIADYNSIANPGAITVGQSIVIPGDILIRNVNDEELTGAFEIIETLKTEQQTGPQNNIVVSANGTQEIELAALETIVEPTTALLPLSRSRPLQTVENDSGTAVTRSKGSLEKSIANFASIIKTNFTLPATIATAINPTGTKATSHQPEETTTIKTAMRNPELASEPSTAISIDSNVLAPTHPMKLQQTALPESLDEVSMTPTPVEAEQWIKVDGNFTPKAIYKGAGYTTGLLMRVSPGSKFKLTSKTDDWYEIETDQGVGYIFHRDVLLSQ